MLACNLLACIEFSFIREYAMLVHSHGLISQLLIEQGQSCLQDPLNFLPDKVLVDQRELGRLST